MNTLDFLRSCSIFSDLDDSLLGALAQITRSKHYEKNEILFGEGDDADALFIVALGAVDLIKQSPDGKEKLIRSVNKGEMFAEAAMFSGEAYPVTAVVKTKSEILKIEKNNFVALVRRNPNISLKIMGVMARLLRHLNSLISDLTLGSVVMRLADYLIKRSREVNSNVFVLEISKRDLAFKIGTIPETLSRNLKKLTEDGIISVNGKQIKINKINKLQSMVTKQGGA